MMQSHQSLDYKLYKVYIWGGLPLLVIYIVLAALELERRGQLGTAGGPWILIPLMLWIAGILLYWWWAFLFKGNRELEELARSSGGEPPGIKSLKSWNTLHRAMTVSGGDVEELIRNAKKANLPIIVWYGVMNLAVCWIFGPFVLGFLGMMPDAAPGTQLAIWVGGIVAWAALMIVVTYVLLGWGGGASETAHLAPLGLAVTEAPRLTADAVGLIAGGQKPIPDGPEIFEGERHGRLIHIETSGRNCLTVVQARLPEFTVRSEAGKLTLAEGAPEAVSRALKGLRKARRWRGIEAHAGPEGIVVRRQSKGTNMWLYDLWLAEYLLYSVDAGQHLAGGGTEPEE